MKIIDILINYANHKNVPEIIKFNNVYYKLGKGGYYNVNNEFLFNKYNMYILNDEVEIIDDIQEITKEVWKNLGTEERLCELRITLNEVIRKLNKKGN